MAVKLLCLCVLLALPFPSWAEKQTCLTSASNCNECIRSGPECAWCESSYVDTQCDTFKGLQRAGCYEYQIFNPQGRVKVVRNDSSIEPAGAQALLLQPQELSLRLRPGVSQSFNLTITMPTDQPITELIMDTSPVPAGVKITFSSIMERNPLVTQVSVEAAQCHSDSDNSTGPWSVHITPRGFSQNVKLEISMECQCEELCRSDPDDMVCSGKGECEDGMCICNKRENPEERISGRYCECTNYDCVYANGRLCGGHGRCECRRCVCDDNWAGVACECSIDTASCMASNQMICNGRGSCRCGVCQCFHPYTGPTCETCLAC